MSDRHSSGKEEERGSKEPISTLSSKARVLSTHVQDCTDSYHGLTQQVEIVQCIYADVSESVLKNSWNKLYNYI